MNISPLKDYKKPLYAAGLAAALVASSVMLTGCENPVDSMSTFFQGLQAIEVYDSFGAASPAAGAGLINGINTGNPD